MKPEAEIRELFDTFGSTTTREELVAAFKKAGRLASDEDVGTLHLIQLGWLHALHWVLEIPPLQPGD